MGWCGGITPSVKGVDSKRFDVSAGKADCERIGDWLDAKFKEWNADALARRRPPAAGLESPAGIEVRRLPAGDWSQGLESARVFREWRRCGGPRGAAETVCAEADRRFEFFCCGGVLGAKSNCGAGSDTVG